MQGTISVSHGLGKQKLHTLYRHQSDRLCASKVKSLNVKGVTRLFCADSYGSKLQSSVWSDMDPWRLDAVASDSY